jgi:hypothetical protein
MLNQQNNNSTYSIGTEAGQTPAFSKKTLFVNEFVSIEEVLRVAKEQSVAHISLKARPGSKENWNGIVSVLISSRYQVTLSYPLSMHKQIVESMHPGTYGAKQFIPLIEVEIEGLEIASSNLTLRVQDPAREGQGTWCWGAYQLRDSNKLTEWKEYTNYAPLDVPGQTPTMTFVPVSVTPEAVVKPQEHVHNPVTRITKVDAPVATAENKDTMTIIDTAIMHISEPENVAPVQPVEKVAPVKPVAQPKADVKKETATAGTAKKSK